MSSGRNRHAAGPRSFPTPGVETEGGASPPLPPPAPFCCGTFLRIHHPEFVRPGLRRRCGAALAVLHVEENFFPGPPLPQTGVLRLSHLLGVDDSSFCRSFLFCLFRSCDITSHKGKTGWEVQAIPANSLLRIRKGFVLCRQGTKPSREQGDCPSCGQENNRLPQKETIPNRCLLAPNDVIRRCWTAATGPSFPHWFARHPRRDSLTRQSRTP